VKERKGPFGQMVGGIVDSVVQTARRRAQDREPRALLYDAAGRPRLLKHGDPAREGLVETGARLIELVGAPAAVNGAAEELDDEVVDAEVVDAEVLEAKAEAETQSDAAEAGADEFEGETPT
jgi:hypothetical protein